MCACAVGTPASELLLKSKSSLNRRLTQGVTGSSLSLLNRTVQGNREQSVRHKVAQHRLSGCAAFNVASDQRVEVS